MAHFHYVLLAWLVVPLITFLPYIFTTIGNIFGMWYLNLKPRSRRCFTCLWAFTNLFPITAYNILVLTHQFIISVVAILFSLLSFSVVDLSIATIIPLIPYCGMHNNVEVLDDPVPLQLGLALLLAEGAVDGEPIDPALEGAVGGEPIDPTLEGAVGGESLLPAPEKTEGGLEGAVGGEPIDPTLEGAVGGQPQIPRGEESVAAATEGVEPIIIYKRIVPPIE